MGESWLMEARKFPAAPALDKLKHPMLVTKRDKGRISTTSIAPCAHVHHKINTAQFPHTTLSSSLQALKAANIHSANTNDFCSGASRGNIHCHLFGLLDIAPDNASIRSEVDESADLGAAYCPRATGTENHFVLCNRSAKNYMYI